MHQYLKLIFIGLVLFAISSAKVYAQCGTIHVSATQILYPDTSTNLPPASKGSSYAEVIQIFVPSLYQGATINSVQLSSVSGLPSGFNYSTYPTSGILNAGTSGCVIIKSPNVIANVGTYPITLNLVYNVQFLGNVSSSFKGYRIVVQNIIPLSLNTKTYQESCAGKMNGSLKLHASGGKPPYLFALDSGNYSSIDSFANLKAGIYTSYVKDSIGTIVSKVDTIINNPKPSIGSILGPVNVSPFATATYGVNQQNGLNFLWSVTNGIILNGQGTNAIQVTWGNQSGNGSILLKATNSFACEDTTSYLVNIKSNGLVEINKILNQAYPIPTSDELHLNLTSINEHNIHIMLYDISGKLLNNYTPTSNLFTIDMRAFANGCYWICIESDKNKSENLRIVKY